MTGYITDEQGKEYELKRCPVMDSYDENMDSIIGLFNSFESGLINLTYREYYDITNGLNEAIAFLKRLKHGRRNEGT